MRLRKTKIKISRLKKFHQVDFDIKQCIKANFGHSYPIAQFLTPMCLKGLIATYDFDYPISNSEFVYVWYNEKFYEKYRIRTVTDKKQDYEYL